MACHNDLADNQSESRMVMGEIRVKVILTNAVDESLNRRRKLKKSAVRRYEADALLDTGAVRSIIPVQVMERLGRLARGKRVVEYADHRTEPVPVTEPIILQSRPDTWANKKMWEILRNGPLANTGIPVARRGGGAKLARGLFPGLCGPGAVLVGAVALGIHRCLDWRTGGLEVPFVRPRQCGRQGREILVRRA